MNDLINKDNIENMVYEIRGVQVMLVSDLAKLYACTNGTKDINKAAKRNIDRFPSDFYFQLTDIEVDNLWFQIGTKKINIETRGGRFKNPHVFTEQGVAMLASVLHTDIAIKTSIKIMRIFVKMRHHIKDHIDYLPNRVLLLEDKVDDNTKRINEIFDKFNTNDIKLPQIMFKGSIYDSYSILIDILNKSKKKIIIIDNYVNKELLDILKDINKQITIISKNINETLKIKYESQYTNITFKNNESFHDRFIIIDDKLLYACGSSFKDLGKKCFFICEVDNKEYLNQIISEVNNE